MRVTIIADASYCPDTRAAGYGFSIASDRGKIQGQDHPKERVTNSIEAEMLALVAGVLHACIHGLLHPGDTLLLQTDCQAAIDAFKEERVRITKQEKELVEKFLFLANELKLKVQYRHVKGHSNVRDARSFINRLCDKNAKDEMNKARKLFPVKLSMTSQGIRSQKPGGQYSRNYGDMDHQDWNGFLGAFMTEEDMLGYSPGDQ